MQKTEISDGSSIGYKFDKVNNVTNTLYKFGGVTKSTTYNHFKSGVVCDVTYPNGATKTRSLNAHAQVRPSYLTTPAGKTWSINRQYYTPTIGGTTYTTNVMGNLIYENIDRTFSYAYNGSGNISKITDKVGTTAKESTFVYDEANQLIRENNASIRGRFSDCPKIRVTDEQAKKIIAKYSKCETVSEFQKLDTVSRDEFIAIFKQNGLSIRQISRLTGVNYYVVQKL